jgi:dTDP-4-dehydrorhamnose 3,5-epimerase
MMKIVLYDARPSSSTFGKFNEFRLGTVRPGTISIPPGVWHGVQNTGDTPAILVNMVDRAYRYKRPDHFALPAVNEEIPYRFTDSPADAHV